MRPKCYLVPVPRPLSGFQYFLVFFNDVIVPCKEYKLNVNNGQKTKAVITNYSFHQGSMYRKVNAVEEIQQTNKDNFWSHTQVCVLSDLYLLLLSPFPVQTEVVVPLSSSARRRASSSRGDETIGAGETEVGAGEKGDRREGGEGEREEDEGNREGETATGEFCSGSVTSSDLKSS